MYGEEFVFVHYLAGLLSVNLRQSRAYCFTFPRPAIFTDLDVGQVMPNHDTGWEVTAGTSVSFDVPGNWTSGRIWVSCSDNFSLHLRSTLCVTGGCNGQLLCDPHTGMGVPPVKVAEWTSAADEKGEDNYDLSVVDGFSIPMLITPTDGPICAADLNTNCPQELVLAGPDGKTVRCKSACLIENDEQKKDSPNCCMGSHSMAATCPSSGVSYYNYFKGPCLTTYTYAYDDNTSFWMCLEATQADYTVTFCPLAQ
ncbi:thaumatin [Desarmillaria tabescens]|uniref:Thaumatin n=1 Tax=Armillaria tabescens TaxID=1929756 RepID=A0AA39NCT7_ARMTA|nr:thaumatin [Desarmillaria tabescens]KAK0463250.1 thaumatin [Desarmillaria tabescens]